MVNCMVLSYCVLNGNLNIEAGKAIQIREIQFSARSPNTKNTCLRDRITVKSYIFSVNLKSKGRKLLSKKRRKEQ